MARPIRDFQSVAQLPLEARNIVAEAERDHAKKRKREDDGMTTASLFGPLAVSLMNAKLHSNDDDGHDVRNQQVGEIRTRTVKRLARRMAPKETAMPEFDAGMFDGDEPSQEQMEAMEASMLGGGKKKPPAPEFMERAEAVVNAVMDSLQGVAITRRRGE